MSPQPGFRQRENGRREPDANRRWSRAPSAGRRVRIRPPPAASLTIPQQRSLKRGLRVWHLFCRGVSTRNQPPQSAFKRSTLIERDQPSHPRRLSRSRITCRLRLHVSAGPQKDSCAKRLRRGGCNRQQHDGSPKRRTYQVLFELNQEAPPDGDCCRLCLLCAQNAPGGDSV
jgi:hypothetical protein